MSGTLPMNRIIHEQYSGDAQKYDIMNEYYRDLIGAFGIDLITHLHIQVPADLSWVYPV